MKKNEKGITLIALIVTIIVMLILVLVTINVAMDGGLFKNAKKAAFQHDMQAINEAVKIRKSEILAENKGAETDFRGLITISELDGISEEAREKYKDKLKVGKNADLQYIADKFTDEEIEWLKELGFTEYDGLGATIIKLIDNNRSRYLSANGTCDYRNLINDVMAEKPSAVVLWGISIKNDLLDYPIFGYGMGSNITNPDLFSYMDSAYDDGVGQGSGQAFYQLFYQLKEISNKYDIPYADVFKAALSDGKEEDKLTNPDAQAEIESLEIDLNGTIVQQDSLGDALGSLALIAMYPIYTFAVIDDDEIIYIDYNGYHDMTDKEQIMSMEEFSSRFNYSTGAESNLLVITGTKKVTKSNLIIPSTVYDNSGNVYAVNGIASQGLMTPTEIDLTEIVDSNLGTIFEDEIYNDTVTLQTCATDVFNGLTEDLELTNNIFNRYIADGVDGSTTSTQLKLKYIGYPIYKLFIAGQTGTEITDSNIESIIDATSDDVFYIKEDGHVYSIADPANSRLVLASEVTPVNSITMYLLADDSFIGFSSYPDYMNSYGDPVCPETISNITIIADTDTIIGSEVFDHFGNTDFTVITGSERDSFSSSTKINGYWQNDPKSITWGVYKLDL